MSENVSNPDKFDIKIVHDKFQAALHENDDVDLELYLESFDELSKWVLFHHLKASEWPKMVGKQPKNQNQCV